MKTFLWLDFEYDFVAANADSLEDAKKNAIVAIEEEFKNECERVKKLYGYYSEDKPEFKENYDKMYDDFVEKYKLEIAYFIKTVNETEPTVLESNTGAMFNHSNE